MSHLWVFFLYFLPPPSSPLLTIITHPRQALHDTALTRDGRLRLPLPAGIGVATFVDDVEGEEVLRAARALYTRHAGSTGLGLNNVVPFGGVGGEAKEGPVGVKEGPVGVS